LAKRVVGGCYPKNREPYSVASNGSDVGGNMLSFRPQIPFMSANASATSPISVKKKRISTERQLSLDLFQAPPGPYHLAKAVTLPGERQTYGVVQGEYCCQIKNPYQEHGLTKAQAERRLQELNESAIQNPKSKIE
jgi:hypothetical protein